jgi:hypothetical protein
MQAQERAYRPTTCSSKVQQPRRPTLTVSDLSTLLTCINASH